MANSHPTLGSHPLALAQIAPEDADPPARADAKRVFEATHARERLEISRTAEPEGSIAAVVSELIVRADPTARLLGVLEDGEVVRLGALVPLPLETVMTRPASTRSISSWLTHTPLPMYLTFSALRVARPPPSARV